MAPSTAESRPPQPPTQPPQQQWSALIVSVARQQDKAAFAQLFGHFAPRIKAFLRRSGLDELAAEELAQEAMLRVWRKADKFDPGAGEAAGWIFTIARNLRIDTLRRARGDATRGASDIDDEYLRDEAPLADEALVQRQSGEQVRRALASLPPDQRRVIELSFYQEEAHGRIAELLDIPLGTVKSRLRLAAAKLRSVLQVMA
jgi:RNA polymerase sigma-70 factor (ECF subfamily)